MIRQRCASVPPFSVSINSFTPSPAHPCRYHLTECPMFVSGPFFTILDPQRRYVPGLTAGDDPGLQVSTISCAGAMTAGSGLDTIARNTSVQMRRRPSRRPKATPSCRISLTRSTYLALAATSDDQRCASPPPIKPPCARQAGNDGRKGALKIIRISFLPMCPILPTPPQHNLLRTLRS